MAIRTGPAGADGIGYLQALQKAAKLGLGCLEVTFTYGVRMKEEQAEAVGSAARALDIVLSVHAPYYVNLAADDPVKLGASRERILAACRMAALMGARDVVFHAGFYQGRPAEAIFARISREIETLQAEAFKNRWAVTLCPETTGKPSQFGSLEECLRLARETGCGFTVDFAHLLARAGGDLDYGEILDRLPRRFHAHFSGIEYGPKGERRHLETTPAFFRPLAAALAGRRLEATLVCESPRPYPDAAMMRRVLDGLRARLPAPKGPLVKRSVRTST
ncbi:MAG: TIM barrel protein [Desulfobacterales bacterium]|jgi:deoxyribonuclease-4|nr:TIM barrel protein [Desulfobacterales bacterium]